MVGHPQGTLTVDRARHANWTQGVLTDGMRGHSVGDAVVVIVGQFCPFTIGSKSKLLNISEKQYRKSGRMYPKINATTEEVSICRRAILDVFWLLVQH